MPPVVPQTPVMLLSPPVHWRDEALVQDTPEEQQHTVPREHWKRFSVDFQLGILSDSESWTGTNAESGVKYKSPSASMTLMKIQGCLKFPSVPPVGKRRLHGSEHSRSIFPSTSKMIYGITRMYRGAKNGMHFLFFSIMSCFGFVFEAVKRIFLHSWARCNLTRRIFFLFNGSYIVQQEFEKLEDNYHSWILPCEA